MIGNFKYFIVFTSAPGVLPEQNDWYRIQPWKMNEIEAYKNEKGILFAPHFYVTTQFGDRVKTYN